MAPNRAAAAMLANCALAYRRHDWDRANPHTSALVRTEVLLQLVTEGARPLSKASDFKTKRRCAEILQTV